MTNNYQDPHLGDLRAMGVMFATPPAGTTNMAGIVFDGAGEPTQIQNPAGVLKDFPAGPPAPGAIPIPANNDGDAVIIESAPGGEIQIRTVAVADGPAEGITISPEASLGTGLVGASVSITGGGSADALGGGVTIGGGTNFTSGATGSQVVTNGGDTNGGDLELVAGVGAAVGALVLRARSGNLAEATSTNDVTIASLGPASGPVSISKWVPVKVDGVAGYLPFFTVDP